MTRNLFSQLRAAAIGAHPDGSVRDLSKPSTKASTIPKMRPDHTTTVLSGSERLGGCSRRRIGSPIKLTSAITCRPNLRVRNSSTRQIGFSRIVWRQQ